MVTLLRYLRSCKDCTDWSSSYIFKQPAPDQGVNYWPLRVPLSPESEHGADCEADCNAHCPMLVSPERDQGHAGLARDTHLGDDATAVLVDALLAGEGAGVVEGGGVAGTRGAPPAHAARRRRLRRQRPRRPLRRPLLRARHAPRRVALALRHVASGDNRWRTIIYYVWWR